MPYMGVMAAACPDYFLTSHSILPYNFIIIAPIIIKLICTDAELCAASYPYAHLRFLYRSKVIWKHLSCGFSGLPSVFRVSSEPLLGTLLDLSLAILSQTWTEF